MNSALLDLMYRIIKRTTGQLKINKVELMKIGFVRKNEVSAINSADRPVRKEKLGSQTEFLSPEPHRRESLFVERVGCDYLSLVSVRSALKYVTSLLTI